MKQILTIAAAIMVLIAGTSCNFNAQKSDSDSMKSETANVESAGVEVIYFHFTRRCVTCKNVEDNSKAAVNELNADMAKKDFYTFKEYNLDEAEGKAVAEKSKVTGQALVVINNGKVTDITASAFMNAKSMAKIKESIKRAADNSSEK